MTLPTTRLAEIAERFETAIRRAGGFTVLCRTPATRKTMIELFAREAEAAARERERMDAELFRDAEMRIRAASLIHDRDAGEWCCDDCDASMPDPATVVQALNGVPHTPDCLVTKLRDRADQLGGRTDG